MMVLTGTPNPIWGKCNSAHTIFIVDTDDPGLTGKCPWRHTVDRTDGYLPIYLEDGVIGFKAEGTASKVDHGLVVVWVDTPVKQRVMSSAGVGGVFEEGRLFTG